MGRARTGWLFAFGIVACGSGTTGSGDASKIPLSRFQVLKLGTMYDNMN